MNNRTLGSEWEEKAAAYLEARGMKILERNFRCSQGEIDLIGVQGEYLVFVEVKYRQNTRGRGSPVKRWIKESSIESAGWRNFTVIRRKSACTRVSGMMWYLFRAEK